MVIPTRTPEGDRNHCHVCGTEFRIDPSETNDAPCPNCGHLLWFSGDVEELEQALTMFLKSVLNTPENLMYRQSLRGIEHQLRNLSKVKPDQQKIAKIRRRVERALAAKNWQVADKVSEEGLALDPTELFFHVSVGDAVAAQGYVDVALFAYHCALRIEPTRRDIEAKILTLEIDSEGI